MGLGEIVEKTGKLGRPRGTEEANAFLETTEILGEKDDVGGKRRELCCQRNGGSCGSEGKIILVMTLACD